MPRTARLDAPGVLQHVIIRGIERRKIFRDDWDRDDLIKRMALLLPETRTACLAWAFMPNHAHFLLRTGDTGISTFMGRLLTGYVVKFNHRHRRQGPLFQNRFRSILCQEDLYLRELVRYIHLNPLRGRVVSHFRELDRYPYSGHSVLMGMVEREWQDTEAVLLDFGETTDTGRKRYRAFVEEGFTRKPAANLAAGQWVRGQGGWRTRNGNNAHDSEDPVKGGERILGETDFVSNVLSMADEKFNRRWELRRQGYDIARVAERVSEVLAVTAEDLFSSLRRKELVRARSLLCFWAVRELGVTLTQMASLLGLTPSAIGYAVSRGESLARQGKYELIP